MKMKIIMLLMVSALILTISGTTQAVSLQPGPLVFKTFNWEVSTGYDGTIGKTYFRSATTPGYDNGNLDHLLFSDASFSSFDTGPKWSADEDFWGLLDITQLWDGTVTGGGTDIASGVKYWDKGDNGEYLRGMFWGGQDQRVFFADDGLGGKIVTIYSTDIQFNVYELDYDFGAGGPQVNSDLEPGDRDGEDYFTNWRGNGEGIEKATGTASFFRFLGDTSVGSVNGQTLVYLDVDGGAWEPIIDDFWTVPISVGGLFDDTASTDLKQTWTILTEAGPWIKSEDVGKGYVVPEPMTMLGMFLGIGGVMNYMRKRQIA